MLALIIWLFLHVIMWPFWGEQSPDVLNEFEVVAENWTLPWNIPTDKCSTMVSSNERYESEWISNRCQFTAEYHSSFRNSVQSSIRLIPHIWILKKLSKNLMLYSAPWIIYYNR